MVHGTRYTKYRIAWDATVRHAASTASLFLQIFHDPLRQRFGRGGILTRVQFTVNHDIGLEKSRAPKLSPEFLNLVLQEEPNILRS